jgi:hypothetical protein
MHLMRFLGETKLVRDCEIEHLPVNWRLSRLIAFGYYDGPTEGVVELADNCGTFFFRLIWMDIELETRILRLTNAPANSVDRLTTMLSDLGYPHWPIWIPIWKFVSEDRRLMIESKVDAMFSDGPTVAVVTCNDSLTECLAARPLDDDLASRIDDWASFMSKTIS